MFRSVIDSAAAADGGSLMLIVERCDGSTESLILNRSIAARGTDDYNRISSDLCPRISPADRLEIAASLEHLVAITPNIHPVSTFIEVLSSTD